MLLFRSEEHVDRWCRSRGLPRRPLVGLETLWQLHYSEEGGDEHNTASSYIANPKGPDQGNYILVTASPKGSFTVFNSGNKQSKVYSAR